MEINDRVFEFIQKIDSQSVEGLRELESISGSLDAYVNNCLSRCGEFENQIFQKRKLVNELVKGSMDADEGGAEPPGPRGEAEVPARALKQDFLDYFFDRLGARLDLDEAGGQRLVLVQDRLLLAEDAKLFTRPAE